MEKDWEAILAEKDWETILAESRAREEQQARDWTLAVNWLEIVFEAWHGGGYPACLAEGTPERRLAVLRELGFRVRERFEVEGEPWARLSGGISVNLADGWVHRRREG